jgi:cation/acetate symporter
LNVAFLVGLAFVVAASANFPVIIFSLFWRRFNTTGAICTLLCGLFSALGLVLIGPAVIGPKGLMLAGLDPIFPLTNPGIVSIPIGFLAGWIGTLASAREYASESRFDELQIRALTGFGAEASAKAH